MRKRSIKKKDRTLSRRGFFDAPSRATLPPDKQKQLDNLAKLTGEQGCVLVIDRAAIDSFMLHFSLSQMDATNKLLKTLATTRLKDKRSVHSHLKIKGKPIILLVNRLKNWGTKTHTIYVSLKPNYLVTSSEEFLEKLASQAIIDALGE